MTDGIKPEESKKSLIQTPIINQAGPIDLTTPHDGQPYADSSHSQTNTPSLPQHLLNHPSDTRDTESATQDAHKPHPELVQIELVKLEDEPPDQPGQLDNDPLSSQTVLDPADALGGAADDSHEWVVENDSEMKRVKVWPTRLCNLHTSPVRVELQYMIQRSQGGQGRNALRKCAFSAILLTLQLPGLRTCWIPMGRSRHRLLLWSLFARWN